MLLLNTSLRFFRRLGDEYEAIYNKALNIPNVTSELIALIAYVNNVEAVDVVQMEDRLREVLKYLLFLSDHMIVSPVDVKQNNTTFNWLVI